MELDDDGKRRRVYDSLCPEHRAIADQEESDDEM
jgi:hypothetical protein